MQISMQMILNKFDNIDFEATILEKTRNIKYARAFNEELMTSDNIDLKDCLVVGKMKDLYPGTTINESVVLMNRMSVVTVYNVNVEYIFNIILEIFDYYNNLELKMYRCMYKKNAEQLMMETCKSDLGNAMLISQQCEVYAATFMSENMIPSFVRASLHGEYYLDKEKFQKTKAYSLMSQNSLEISNYSQLDDGLMYNYMLIHILSGDKTHKYLLLFDTCSELEFRLDCSYVYLEMVTMMAKGRYDRRLPVKNSQEFSLYCLIKGFDVKLNRDYLAKSLGLTDHHVFMLVVLKGVSLSESKKVEIFLEKSKGVLQSYTDDERYILLYAENYNALNTWFRKFANLLKNGRAELGCSLLFTYQELTSASLLYQQAVAYIEQNHIHMSDGDIYMYWAKYLFNERDKEKRKLASHWLVKKLELIDWENGSDYLKTLEIYLMNSHGTTATAEMLFVHKNTVQNRIKYIEELLGYGLRKGWENLYITLSILAICEK